MVTEPGVYGRAKDEPKCECGTSSSRGRHQCTRYARHFVLLGDYLTVGMCNIHFEIYQSQNPVYLADGTIVEPEHR